MKYPLEIYFAIEVARSLIKEDFFISEGQKGRGLEEPPLVGGACFVFFVSRLNKLNLPRLTFPDRTSQPVLSDLV